MIKRPGRRGIASSRLKGWGPLRGRGCAPRGLGCNPSKTLSAARCPALASAHLVQHPGPRLVGRDTGERSEHGARATGLDLFLGHFGTHRQEWRCVACEGLGFDVLGRCEECCGWGWFLWPESLVLEAFS